MSPLRGKDGGAARVAVVGASSAAGALIREALRNRGVPGSRIALFGTTGGEIALSEYDGEARLIQEPDPAEVAAHDVVFLCEPGDATRQIVARVKGGSLMIDLIGTGRREGPPLVHPGINPDAARTHRGVIAFPHPLAVLLAEILQPIERALGIREAAAVVLRPASDFGERGLEELRDQTVGLLRFAEPPKELFGRSLAFNLIPQHSLGPVAEPDLSCSLAYEIGRLMGWETPRVSVSLIVVPVFHGHAVSARVHLGGHATASEVRAALDVETGRARETAEAPTTPMEAAIDGRTVVSEVSEDGLGGFWLWAVAGDAGAKWADKAVQLAGTALEL